MASDDNLFAGSPFERDGQPFIGVHYVRHEKSALKNNTAAAAAVCLPLSSAYIYPNRSPDASEILGWLPPVKWRVFVFTPAMLPVSGATSRTEPGLKCERGARERRRLFMNILIAVGASFLMGGVSLMYHRYSAGTVDLFGIFRIVFISLAAGYLAYMAAKLLRRYRQMTEHKKDVMFLAMKYWGFLRPESIIGHLLLVVILVVLYAVVFYPEALVNLTGSETLTKWVNALYGKRCNT